MYLVSDTVEEAVYDISVERRLAHVRTTRNQKRLLDGNGSSGPSASASGMATPAVVDVETAIDAANEVELRDVRLDHLLAKGFGGGEVVGKEDLWECLFGRKKRKGRGVDLGIGKGGEEVGVVGRFLAGEAAAVRNA